jgi:hypothetical protein
MSIVISVFNVTDNTIGWGIAPLAPDGGVTDNSPSLNSMIQNLLSPSGITQGKGGVLEFPAGDSYYSFSETITIGPVGDQVYPPNVILRGTGAQDRDFPILQMTDLDTDFFVIDNPGGVVSNSNLPGIVFEDLIISYQPTDEMNTGGASGIQVLHGNVRIQRVLLNEVPGYAIDLFDTLKCSIIDSVIRVQVAQNAVGMRIGDWYQNQQAIETYVAGVTIGAYNGKDTPQTGTGILIYGAEHLRMNNCRIEGWQNGIIIEPKSGTENTRKLYFGNVSAFTSQAALQIIPATPESGNVYVAQIWFAQCEFAPGTNVGDYDGAGIIVGTGANGDLLSIDNIRFVDCFSCFWPGPGLQIVGGTNIEVVGGLYSCNGTYDGEPAFSGASSGIAITGPAVGVKLADVTCNNVAYNTLEPPMYGSHTQDDGVYIGDASSAVHLTGCVLAGNLDYGVWLDATTSSPSSVYIKACDLTGNGTGPVNISGTITSAQIVDCAGYNDSQTAAITTSTPSSGVPVHATDHGYFGPAIAYVAANSNVTAVKVNGVTTGLKTGTFYLGPAQSIELDYSGLGAPGFCMMGE